MFGIFGILTTLINVISFYIFHFYINYLLSNAIAWLISILFAYITNRMYVFNSTVSGLKNIIKEFNLFLISRLLSGVLDMALMFIFIDFLHWDNFSSKVLVNIFVVITNYLFSKLLVFNLRGNDN
ncbi:GtrA family protein [Paenibacillus macerans]